MTSKSNYIEEVTKLLASLDGQQENTKPEIETPIPDTQEPIEDIYVLIFRENGADQDEQFIDSTLTEPSTNIPPSPAPIQPLPGDKASKRIAYALLSVSLLMLASIIMLQLSNLITLPAATITIVATETPVTAHAAISLPAHVFTPLIFSQSQTISTTGRTHQNATQATGFVTFYNSLLSPQTIDAGTLLTGSDNVQVVTDETAYIPQANPPTFGQVTVSAHAVNAGSGGNINAGDISGTCCRVYILVKNNQPFTGGQTERDYQSVAKADIQNVVSNLSQQFQQTLQTKTASLISSDETLITPIPCTSNMQSNHPAGAEAMQVTVTLHETCTPVSYNTQDFQSQAESILSQAAILKLGTGYSLLGNVETSIVKTMLKNTSLILTVVCNGMWAYQFNIHQLAALISGKSQQEATALLRQQNGITHISLLVSGTKANRLPLKPDQIHFLIFYEPS